MKKAIKILGFAALSASIFVSCEKGYYIVDNNTISADTVVISDTVAISESVPPGFAQFGAKTLMDDELKGKVKTVSETMLQQNYNSQTGEIVVIGVDYVSKMNFSPEGYLVSREYLNPIPHTVNEYRASDIINYQLDDKKRIIQVDMTYQAFDDRVSSTVPYMIMKSREKNIFDDEQRKVIVETYETYGNDELRIVRREYRNIKPDGTTDMFDFESYVPANRSFDNLPKPFGLPGNEGMELQEKRHYVVLEEDSQGNWLKRYTCHENYSYDQNKEPVVYVFLENLRHRTIEYY